MTRLARLLRRRGTNERGAVAVELALITPFLATLLLGIVEFGSVMNTQQGLEAASREGARFATIDADITQNDIITHTMNALEESANVVVTVTPDVAEPCDGREGQNVTVTIQVPETIEILFIGVTNATLEASSVFECLDG